MENKEAFFELLKQHRESQDIKISEICEFTKINPKYIEAIEVGEFTILPNVYMRLFLRAYADFIKADSKKALEDYELFTTGKIIDTSNLETEPDKNNKSQTLLSDFNKANIPQIPPQKIITIVLVSLGLILSLYWASKVTGEQSVKSDIQTLNKISDNAFKKDSLKTVTLQESSSKVLLTNPSQSTKNRLNKISKKNKLSPSNSESKPANYYLSSNKYLIQDRESESTNIIKISPPYKISIKAMQTTRVNISKANSDSSRILINGLINKNDILNFEFETTINFDFVNNSHLEVKLNDISLDKYLNKNGSAIRGSYETDNYQLYIGFYKSN